MQRKKKRSKNSQGKCANPAGNLGILSQTSLLARAHCHVSKSEMTDLFQEHTRCPSVSSWLPSPHSPVPRAKDLWEQITNNLTWSYLWHYSWECVTLAKVSHLQPASPWSHVNRSALQRSKHSCLRLSHTPQDAAVQLPKSRLSALYLRVCLLESDSGKPCHDFKCLRWKLQIQQD